MTAVSILSYGDVYNTLAEELNNAVIESWENATLKQRIAEASELGAKAGEYDATHDCESSNPFGCDSEPLLYEAWEAAHEDSFEATR